MSFAQVLEELPTLTRPQRREISLPLFEIETTEAKADDIAVCEQCNEDLQQAYANARTVWRGKAATLAQLGRDLEDLSEAWHADATRAFPVGTPEGDTLRSTIPTTEPPKHG